jgi:hypothetical protein
MEEKAMYSRTILLAAASLAVAGTANAAPVQLQSAVTREQVSATLHIHHYRLLSDPHFVRGHYVARSVNPSGRVVLAEINPENGALMGEILI